jgi:hypothetical protein
MTSVSHITRLKSGALALGGRQVYIQAPLEAAMDRLGIDYGSLWKASLVSYSLRVYKKKKLIDRSLDGRTSGIPENA